MSTLIDMNTKKRMLAKIPKLQMELQTLFAEQEAGKKSRVKMYPIKAGTGLTVDGPEEPAYEKQPWDYIAEPEAGMPFRNFDRATPYQTPEDAFTLKDKWDVYGKPAIGKALGGANLMQLAPAFANLIGGKAEQLNPRDYYNPRRDQITSLMRNRRTNIQPQLDVILNSEKTGQYNLRNTANTRGEMMGNNTALNNNAARQRMAAYAGKQNMDLNYQGQEAEMLMGLGAGEQQANWNTMTWNKESLANKRNMFRAGLSQLSQYSQVKELNKNQLTQDENKLAALKDMFASIAPYMASLQNLKFSE